MEAPEKIYIHPDYTSLEQSKKLAEILPIESANMHYATWTILDGEFIVSPNQGNTIESLQEDFGSQIIPCWSLGALLNYLREIDLFPEIDADKSVVTMNINYYNEDEARLLAPIHNIKVKAESFIDACVEMIIKLHEQKLL